MFSKTDFWFHLEALNHISWCRTTTTTALIKCYILKEVELCPLTKTS